MKIIYIFSHRYYFYVHMKLMFSNFFILRFLNKTKPLFTTYSGGIWVPVNLYILYKFNIGHRNMVWIIIYSYLRIHVYYSRKYFKISLVTSLHTWIYFILLEKLNKWDELLYNVQIRYSTIFGTTLRCSSSS